jgi:hypothetical protein
MLNQIEVTSRIWTMLEELYLDASHKAAKIQYAGSSEADKRAILVKFAKRQAIKSKRWVTILQYLPARDPIADREIQSVSSTMR